MINAKEALMLSETGLSDLVEQELKKAEKIVITAGKRNAHAEDYAKKRS